MEAGGEAVEESGTQRAQGEHAPDEGLQTCLQLDRYRMTTLVQVSKELRAKRQVYTRVGQGSVILRIRY